MMQTKKTINWSLTCVKYIKQKESKKEIMLTKEGNGKKNHTTRSLCASTEHVKWENATSERAREQKENHRD